MRPLLLVFAAVTFVASGCAAPEAMAQAPARYGVDEVPVALRPAVERAEAAMTALQASLLRRLQEATRDGAGAAVDVCRIEAGAIRDRVVAERALAVGRTSHALRNHANVPPAWASALVTAGAGKRASEVVARVFDLGDKVGVIRPIPMGMLCSNCHGPAEALNAEVRATLQRAYPNDAATGFNEGDLRGWIWAEVSKD